VKNPKKWGGLVKGQMGSRLKKGVRRKGKIGHPTGKVLNRRKLQTWGARLRTFQPTEHQGEHGRETFLGRWTAKKRHWSVYIGERKETGVVIRARKKKKASRRKERGYKWGEASACDHKLGQPHDLPERSVRTTSN